MTMENALPNSNQTWSFGTVSREMVRTDLKAGVEIANSPYWLSKVKRALDQAESGRVRPFSEYLAETAD